MRDLVYGFLQQLPNRATVFPPQSVTSRATEADPADVGVSPAVVEEIWRCVVSYYETGLQPAMALTIRRGGKVILDRAIGHVRGNDPSAPTDAPVPVSTDTLFNMFSASKCITSMLIHLYDDRGLVHLDDPVAEYIPEFACNGKQHITIRHLLTHRAGIPLTPAGHASLDNLDDPAKVIALICEAEPISLAGRKQAYHALAGGLIMAEILSRVSDMPVRDLLEKELCEPLGFTHLRYGVPHTDLDRVAREVFTGPLPRGPFRNAMLRSIGLELQEAIPLANDPRFLTGVVPSGNVIASANEVSRFFELLLRQGTLDGVKIFPARTIKRAVAEYRRFRIDGVIGLPVRYGLGFMLGGQHIGFYGRRTPRAFGHLGFTNVLAWADPERDISVAFMNTGKPLITPELVLWMRIMWAISDGIPRDYGGDPNSPWR